MTKNINRWPAWLDMVQGFTGLILVLFMWAHMFFVSSILISHDAMYWVARMFEGEPLFGKPYPILVTLVAVGIFTLLLVHALLALRKVPSNVQQYQAIHQHTSIFKHGDTWLWVVQVISGFLLMFLASIHLYQLMLNPADIGPYASSDRVWSGRMWPLYLILLFVVEIHGGVGFYRLAMKWGWFLGKDVKKNRRRLQVAKWLITVFFLILGCATLQAYMKIGYDHQSKVGERYIPAPVQSQSQNPSKNSGSN
jgi:fumarate reductase subunit C